MGRRKGSGRSAKGKDVCSINDNRKRKKNNSPDGSLSDDPGLEDFTPEFPHLTPPLHDLTTIIGKYTQPILERSRATLERKESGDSESLPICFTSSKSQGRTFINDRFISVNDIKPNSTVRSISRNVVTDLSVPKVADALHDSLEQGEIIRSSLFTPPPIPSGSMSNNPVTDFEHDVVHESSTVRSSLSTPPPATSEANAVLVTNDATGEDRNDEAVQGFGPPTDVNHARHDGDESDPWDEDEFADMPELEPVTPPPVTPQRLEGVDYDHKYNETRGSLDGLPCHDDPRLPSRDVLCLLQEPRLIPTYVHLPLLYATTNYIQFGRTSTTTPYRGISIDNFVRDSSPERVHFIMRAIQFLCHGTEVANISRCNPFCADLRFEILRGDTSYQPNEFLTFDHRPLLCTSLVVVVLSNLSEPRLITGATDQYAIKDVRVQFLKHEYERMISFMGAVSGCRVLYVNGIATGEPLIGISTRFTKFQTLKDRNFGTSSNMAIHAENYQSPQAPSTPQPTRHNVLSNYVLYPSDDVPIYDLSGLTFDFANDFNLETMEENFVRLRGEIRRNCRCIVAYYPSIWRREGKTLVSLNIKWIGSIDP